MCDLCGGALSIQTMMCPRCVQNTPHTRARAGIIMCTICRHQRPWNTTGMGEGSLGRGTRLLPGPGG
jgi:hypothetical protein